MTPEQATRLTDIVARVVRGEPGSGEELMREARMLARWRAATDSRGSRLVAADGSSIDLRAGPDGSVSAAWTGAIEPRRDLVGLTLDEAKAKVTAEFEAGGYVVLP
jgi:hypothetical protein